MPSSQFFMTIRPAYSDELARAKTLLDGHPVPPEAGFLVGVKEQPVERLVATIPWWEIPLPKGDGQALRFNLQSQGGLDEETLHEILRQLEDLARENQLTTLLTDFSLPEDHPLYARLVGKGYEIALTDRYFSMPGEPVNLRCLKLYHRAKKKFPNTWKVESIRGHSPEKIFSLVGEQALMSSQQFQNYWDRSNHEHFEERYSCVVVEEEQVIATFLVTQRGTRELHIHVDVVAPSHRKFSGLLTIAMRNFTSSACPEGFPEIYTSRADSKAHLEGGNTPLRHKGASEGPPRHFLEKEIQSGTRKTNL